MFVVTMVLLGPAGCGKGGQYTHDPAGDTALPYKHDPAAGFYRYDKRRCFSVLDREPPTAAVVG